MLVHNYHPETKAYLGTHPADESPLEPGVFLMPAHTTTVAPPPFVDGQFRVFDGESWQYVTELPETGREEPPLPDGPPPGTPEPEGNTVAGVIAERERRLAAGFIYDFGDERGMHVIGTTPDDMAKWTNEVTPWASSAIARGLPDDQIEIFTETGPVSVTAMEWQAILGYAKEVRQPIYRGSFILQVMDPIPEDYRTNDSYWMPQEPPPIEGEPT